MSHVDDGTLHAYLDGDLTPVERARLEAHVAECAACRAGLDEARALIERAGGLLGLAQPPERSAPLLHQLRRPRLAWRLRVPLTWAATVVLALGIGYYVGDRSMARAPGISTLAGDSPASSSAAADSGTALAREKNATDGLAPAERREVAARPRSHVAAPAREAERQPQVHVDGAPVRSEGDSAAVASRDTVAAAAASGVIAIQPRDVRASSTAAPRAQPAAPPSRALEEVVVLQPGVVANDLAAVRGRLVATQWPIIRRGPARDILGAEPVGVPGLAVRNIRRSPTGEVVMVEQAIDSATVIQLFQQRVEGYSWLTRSDSFRAAEPVAGVERRFSAAGTERLARFIGGVRVEIAGPLSADSLNRLLEQVKPIGP